MWGSMLLSGLCIHAIGVMSSPTWNDQTPLKVQRSSNTIPDMTDESYRLPKTFTPYKYDLQIEPNIYEGHYSEFVFNGVVKILVRCQISTNMITLHANNLEFEAVTVREFGTGRTHDVLQITKNETRQFAVISVAENLRQGKLYFLEITFQGPILQDNRGLYLSYYYENETKQYLVTTQMEPTDARKLFPCFDEPSYKAIFNITIIRRADYTALSNARKIGEQRIDKNRFIDYFEPTPKMSTYLVAMVVSKFVHVSTETRSGSQFNVWVKPADINKTELALYDGAAIQTFFEDYLEMEYPLPKQDMVEVPHFTFGAMENWGLIIYRPYLLIFEPNGNMWWKKNVVEVVAHELAHQWFGNIVTLHWWSDIWLNEGFANFFQYIGSGFRYPDWNQREEIISASIHRAKGSDSYTSNVPMHNPVATRPEIIDMFGSTSYNKGGAILRMMEHFMGRENFRQGLVRYMKKNKYRNTRADDLWNAMGDISDMNGNQKSIKSIMDTWIYQSNFPLVNVRQDDRGRLHLSQKRYLTSSRGDDDDAYPPPNGYIWSIPFTYTTSSEKNFNKTSSDIIWFDQEEMVIDTPSTKRDEWIIANIQEFGYYRVNYTRDNWVGLADQLKKDRDVIHPVNRASLIDDSRDFSYSGQLDNEIMNMIYDAAQSDTYNIAPLSATVSAYRQTNSLLSDTKTKKKFKSFVQESIGKQYQENSLVSSPQTMEAAERRKIIVEAACDFGVEACTQEAVELYRNWMNSGGRQKISPDIQKAVICSAISEGGQEEWNFAFEQYKRTSATAERMDLLEGMACSRSASVLHRYLELSITSDDMAIVDSVKAIDAVSNNEVGRRLVWKFLNDNWDTIKQRFGKDGLPLEKLLAELSTSFHTEEDIREIEAFKKAHQDDLGSAELPLKQDLERTETNMRWMNKNQKAVEEWLDKRR